MHREADETTLFPAAPRTKWGVGAADMDESDVDEQLPTVAPDLDGPAPPEATDPHARRRAKRLRRTAVLDARTAANAAPAPTGAAQTAARTARHARRQHPAPALAEPAADSDEYIAAAHPRAARHRDQGDTLPDLADGSSSEGEDPTPAHPRRAPVARSVAVTAAPAADTPSAPASPAPDTPAWLKRTSIFDGVPLSLDVKNPEGIWVMATTAQAAGRSATDIPVPRHYNQATRSPDWHI